MVDASKPAGPGIWKNHGNFCLSTRYAIGTLASNVPLWRGIAYVGNCVGANLCVYGLA